MRVGTRGRALALGLLHCSAALCRAAMANTKKSRLLISLLLLLLLVSTVHGARLVADAKDNGTDGKRVTAVRTGVAGHGHSYSSHRSHNPNGPDEGNTGTSAVDPHNVAARGHHHRGAASRTLGYSAPATFTLLGAAFLVVLV